MVAHSVLNAGTSTPATLCDMFSVALPPTSYETDLFDLSLIGLFSIIRLIVMCIVSQYLQYDDNLIQVEVLAVHRPLVGVELV